MSWADATVAWRSPLRLVDAAKMGECRGDMPACKVAGGKRREHAPARVHTVLEAAREEVRGRSAREGEAK